MDSEPVLFLVAPFYFPRKWASKKLPMETTFFVAAVNHWTRNCSCIDCLAVCCQTGHAVSVGRWPLSFGRMSCDDPSDSCFAEKTVRNSSGLKESDYWTVPKWAEQIFCCTDVKKEFESEAEDGYPNFIKELWVTVQADRCHLCHI